MMGHKRRSRTSVRTRRSWGVRLVCEHLEARTLLAVYVVTSPGDHGTATLRWAINQVNADSTPDVIQFDIGSGGVQSITLASVLPALTNSATIDGTTQPGSTTNGAQIVIDGSGLAAGSNGLTIDASGCVIRGLAIVGFSGSGLVLAAPGGDLVEGNDLGVLPSGAVRADGTGLTIVSSSSNTIGGGGAGLGNVISGNSGFGLAIESGTALSSNNVLHGNLIGTAADGLTALGNTLGGVVVSGGSANQIGGAGAGLGNVLSGNSGPGLEVEGGATGTLVQGNLIGIGSDGKTPVGNLGDGVLIDGAAGTQLGGTDQGQGNVISANQANGIETQGDGTSVVVLGNDIGTDATGLLDLGNRFNGVSLATSSNSIGGTAAGAGNTIDYNGSGTTGAGIQLVGNVVQNTFLSNSIYENDGLGINLGSGPTSNHAPGTPGPNDYQNYPVLNLARSEDGETTVTGTLTAAPSTLYVVQFFASPSESSSGFGQGKTLIGTLDVTTDASGNASLSVPGTSSAPGSYISATATSPVGDTSEFCQDIQSQGVIDLRLSALAAPNPAPSGGDVTFTLTVTNQGSENADQVVLTDVLPSDGTVVSVSSSQGFILPGSGGSLTASLGTIAAGASATVTVVFQTSSSFSGSITDSASVASQETDPYPAYESASATVQVEMEADLSVALTATPNPAPIEGDVTFTTTVTNLGPSTASSATASLPLPAGFTFVSATSSVGTATFANGTASAAFGDLAVNAQATLTVIAQASQLGPTTLTAVAASTNIDPNPGNNSSSTTVTVAPAADLAVTAAASAARVVAGGDLQYQITLANAGPDAASGVVLSDTLPGSVLLVSATSDQNVTPTMANGVVTLVLDSLAAGATALLTIEVQTTGPPQQTITDTASVTSQTLDLSPGDESSSVATQIVGQSDLGISASVTPSSAYVGENLVYTLTATNAGPFDEPNAVVSAQLPSDMQFSSGSTSLGSPPNVDAQGLLTANIGDLAAGSTAVVSVSLIPGSAEVGAFPLSFQIQGQNIDPNAANNTATATVQVAAAAALAIQIAPPAAPAYDQVPWTYNLVVTNPGPCPATGVVVSAPLPAGSQFLSATSAGSSPSLVGNTITDPLGALAVGATATIAITVEPLAAGSLTTLATVNGNQLNPNPAGAGGSLTVNVAPSANLAVSLAAAPASALTGRPITFGATVSNQGPDPATGVTLSLPIPPGFVYDSTSAATSAIEANQVVANLGILAPGATATVSVVFTAAQAGLVSETATATSPVFQINPYLSYATATATAIESAGTLAFSSSRYAVPETAGQAVLTVDRVDGSLGAVSIPFSTVDINATPGLDYLPVSGTLTFAAGQTAATIVVPVLANPWDNHDEWLSVVLGAPTAGAILGATSSAQLQIIDVDPNTTPPQVSNLTWNGNAQAIWNLTVGFTAAMNPTYAADSSNYVITTAAGQVVPVSASYNMATRTVLLTPVVFLPSGQAYNLRVVGTGATAIRDVSGNVLAGQAPNVPGLDYSACFEQGTKFSYLDNAHNRVFMRVRGPGYLEQVRSATGEGEVLTVIGMAPRKSVLMGHVQKLRGGTGRTDIGVLNGLGQFGQMTVKLASPPFFARVFPFMRRGRGLF